MTAYTSLQIAAGKQPRYLPEGMSVLQIATFAASTAFAANDTIAMVNIQANPAQNANGPSMTGLKLDVPRLDTGGTPTLAMEVGDSTNAARYIAPMVVGGTANGTVQSANVGGSTGYQPFANSFATYTTISNQFYTVLITVTAAAATFQAGQVTLLVDYTYDP